MKKELLEIINEYGVINQVGKLSEEVSELQAAIYEYEFFEMYSPENVTFITVDDDVTFDIKGYKKKLKEHIEEEIADVMVLLSQFYHLYDMPSENIKNNMKYKIARQINRINEEREN